MDDHTLLTPARLLQLPADLERSIDELLSQKIQVVEFRAQLNQATTTHLQLKATEMAGVRWPERLRDGLADLGDAIELLERFWSDARLTDLDQSIVKLRAADFALKEALGPQPSEPNSGAAPPAASSVLTVQRWNQVTRAAFTCPQCGWELGYSREIESDEFLDVELEEFECPLCNPETVS